MRTTFCTLGLLGFAMPEAYGGSGLGVTEASILMRTIAASGAALQGCSSIHVNLFGPMPLVKFGTEYQRKEYLPRLISGGPSGRPYHH